MEIPDQGKSNTGERFRAAVGKAEKELAICPSALQASRAGVARPCPGSTRQPVLVLEALGCRNVVRRIKELKDSIAAAETRLRDLTEWVSLLPGDITEARAVAEQEIQKQERHMREEMARLPGAEVHYEQHGNIDYCSSFYTFIFKVDSKCSNIDAKSQSERACIV